MTEPGKLTITPELLARLGVTERQLLNFIKKWKITELALFGSILRDDFGPGSDVDFLVVYGDPTTRNIFDRVEMRGELRRKMKRKVDLINKYGLSESRNSLRRDLIMANARVIYEG